MFAGAVSVEQGYNIRIDSESGSLRKNVIRYNEIAIFAYQFLFGVLKDVVRFGGKANESLIRFPARQVLGRCPDSFQGAVSRFRQFF